MKKLISLFLILTQLLPATSLAAISAPDRADIPAPMNAVTNSSGQRGLAGWVKGGTPTFSVSTSAGEKVAGVASFTFNAASSSDYVETGALTLTDDTTGDCEASISVKGNGTGYTLQLMSGANVLYSMALTNNTGFKTHAFNYPCASGYKLRVASSGDGASIKFGAVYWGKATNLTQGAIVKSPAAAGFIQPFAGGTVPTGWMLCDGSAISRTTYAELFAAIGTTWGAGDGSTTFKIPNLINRYLRGAGAASDGQGGTTVNLGAFQEAATRIYTAMNTGGQNANHTHESPLNNYGSNPYGTGGDHNNINGASVTWGTSVITSVNSNDHFHAVPAGSGDAETRPKSYGVNYIIKLYNDTTATAVRQDQTFDRTGEIMAIAGGCPTNTVSAMNKTIGRASGDYQGDAYYALYAKMWRSDLATSGQGVTISSAAGASATADWAAGKTIKLDFTDLFLRGVGTSNTKTGQYQDDRFQGHRHSLGYSGNPTSGYGGLQRVEGTEGSEGWVWDPITDGTNGTPRTANETRPMNVGVNYCVNYTGVAPVPVIMTGNDYSVRYYTNTNPGQLLNTGVASYLNFEGKEWDSHGAVTVAGGTYNAATGTWSGGAWKFAAPISGEYEINLSLLTINTTANGTTRMVAAIFKNGSHSGRSIYSNYSEVNGSTTLRSLRGAVKVKLLVGEYVHIVLDQNFGVNSALYPAVWDANWVEIRRVGNY